MTQGVSRAWCAEDLVYDPLTHTTRLPNGIDVPHVTTVLTAVGVTTDFNRLVETVGPRMAGHLELGRARGTAVHADCHAFDDGELAWSNVDDRVAPYVRAWGVMRREKGLVPLTRERRGFHRHHVYTGTLDGIFRDTIRSKIVLADIKTGDPDDAAAHIQTAAYELMWQDEHPDIAIDERWAIWLRPDRRIVYTVVNYTARPDGYADRGRWLACLAVYNEQPARRLRIK